MSGEIKELIKRIGEYYDLPGTLEGFHECKNGHINTTYIVVFASGGKSEEYIFQRINSYVFKEPEKVMSNIKEIALHLRSKRSDSDCDIISFLDNREGKNYTQVDGEYWRVCPYVPNSVTYDTVENSQVLASAGYAFGRFQALLADFPMEKLHETIPDFHNTRKRLEDFFQVVEQDPVGRVVEVKEEIAFFEKHRSIATKLVELQEMGELPLRVTHNDTKYNNILMHRETCEPLCVIDLDTVMPGLAMYDFGDAIRFAANTAPEDETDLSRVGLNMDHYREFTRGFMKAAGDFLTEKEKEYMALGAVVITIELASRFLADHLNGDKYFRIHRENHNLDRARCQIRLAQDMLDKYEEMCRIVNEI